MPTPKAISPVDLNNLREAGGSVLLIDVRSSEEFHGAHACGAVNIPLDKIDAGKVTAVGGSEINPVYVICRGGARSAQACSVLTASGYEHVFNVETGTDGWIEAGLPTRISNRRGA